jgi:hypothetical protein
VAIDYIKNYASNVGGEIEIKSVIHKSDPIKFLAFITSFSDNMTSSWNEESVYGRQDVIGTFQNTTRKISLGFDLPSKDLAEAKDNLHKINKIKQFLYPAYSTSPKNVGETTVTTNALSLSKAPLMRVKFANLIQNQGEDGLLGWFGSFSATPVIDMGMFTDNKSLFPKVYNVSIDFTPQHEYDLGINLDGSPLNSDKFPSFPYSGGVKS